MKKLDHWSVSTLILYKTCPWKFYQIKHKGILVRGTLNTKGEEKNTRITYIHLTGQEGLDYEYGKVKQGTNSTYAVVNLLSIHFKYNKIYFCIVIYFLFYYYLQFI